jgi:hypothetical protein
MTGASFQYLASGAKVQGPEISYGATSKKYMSLLDYFGAYFLIIWWQRDTYIHSFV